MAFCRHLDQRKGIFSKIPKYLYFWFYLRLKSKIGPNSPCRLQFVTIKTSSAGDQTPNSSNASTSYDSHAATSTQPSTASNRGYYINHFNYQHYSYARSQDLQHSSNNKQIITTSASLGFAQEFFIFNNIILNTYYIRYYNNFNHIKVFT